MGLHEFRSLSHIDWRWAWTRTSRYKYVLPIFSPKFVSRASSFPKTWKMNSGSVSIFGTTWACPIACLLCWQGAHNVLRLASLPLCRHKWYQRSERSCTCLLMLSTFTKKPFLRRPRGLRTQSHPSQTWNRSSHYPHIRCRLFGADWISCGNSGLTI